MAEQSPMMQTFLVEGAGKWIRGQYTITSRDILAKECRFTQQELDSFPTIIFAETGESTGMDLGASQCFVTPEHFDKLPSQCPAILFLQCHAARLESSIKDSLVSPQFAALARNLMPSKMSDDVLQASMLEYSLHEAGHGMLEVFDQRMEVLSHSSIRMHAYEEARADGMACLLARDHLNDSNLARYASSLFLVRFCVDAFSQSNLDISVSEIWAEAVVSSAKSANVDLSQEISLEMAVELVLLSGQYLTAVQPT